MGERRRFEQWVYRYTGDLYRHAYWLGGTPPWPSIPPGLDPLPWIRHLDLKEKA